MLKVKKLYSNSKLPKRALDGDAGFDVFCIEDFEIPPFERKTVSIGVSAEFPKGWMWKTLDKSGYAIKGGVFNIAGVVDSNYRGEIFVCLLNFTHDVVKFVSGQKVSQFVLIPCYSGDIEEIFELSNSNRGTGGFGSTGDV